MPICRIDDAPGIGIAAKKKMVERSPLLLMRPITSAIPWFFFMSPRPKTLPWMGGCCRKTLKIQEILQKIGS